MHVADPTQDLAMLLANLQQYAAARPASRPAVGAMAGERGVDAIMRVLLQFAGFRPSEMLRRKLEQVFRDTPLEEIDAWIARTRDGGEAGAQELAALVEDLTNHETFFFRDPPQLEVLSTTIFPQLIRRKLETGQRSITIWSAACSTGEEAYTLAMLLLQALIDARVAFEVAPGVVRMPSEWRCSVLGTDISRQALRVARGATYPTSGLASFRQFPQAFMRFFEDVKDQANNGGVPSYRRVTSTVRDLVRFEQFNLINRRPPLQDVDLVLCRNVLIYIDQAQQPAIQSMLCDALRRGGHLIMSPVDTLLVKDRFHERWSARCVTYERK